MKKKSKLSLGKRLNTILSFIDDNYEEIWDTCCDHGKLGLACLEQRSVYHVTFVDQVESIINTLNQKLNKIPNLDPSKFTTMCSSAQTLKLNSKRGLICICGVGGDVAINIITELLKNNDLTDYDLLIDAQYQIFDLRKFLINKNFKLHKEALFFDGKWAHEMLLVSQSATKDISKIGQSLFVKNESEHIRYIKGLANHYKKKSLHNEKFLEAQEMYFKLLTDLL